MDQRRSLTDETLRRAVQERQQPFEPLCFTERTMRAVRRAHEQRLRRERRLFLLPVVVGVLLLIGSTIWCGHELAQLPAQAMSWSDFLIGSVLLCCALLYLLQEILCRLWKIPK